MTRDLILLDRIGGREAAALIVGGQLDDLLVAADAPAPGTIYRARVDRPIKGQGGVFLSTPDGPAYLRKVKGLAPGATLLVQVTGYAEPGKALPVTAQILFKSRFAIVTPDAPGLNLSRQIRDEEVRAPLLALARDEMAGVGFGLILRSAAADADPDEVREDIRRMRSIAEQVLADAGDGIERLLDGDEPHALAWREWSRPATVTTAEGCFDAHGVLEAAEALLAPRVALPGGGHLFVEPTRALVAVDVNSGADVSFAAGLKSNLAAAQALPRILRLRGLGGQITIDFAPMPQKDRRQVETALRAALKSDGEDTVMAGWTPLGHYELQRKRGRIPLAEVLR